MSGLTRFVGRENRPPTPPAAGRKLDTSQAQALKFGVKSGRFEPGPAPPGQLLPSTAPAPGYASNHNAPRNTDPYKQFAKHQPAPYTKTLDDVTVNSDFDDTKTDLGYNLEDGNGDYGEEDDTLAGHQYQAQADPRYSQGLPQHTLHHVHAQVPLVVNPEFENMQSPFKPQASGTHSRFKSVKPVISQNTDAMNQENAALKKRQRLDEPPRQNYTQQRRPYTNEFEESDEDDLPGPQSKERQNGLNSFGISSDEAESQSESPSRPRKARIAPSSQPKKGDGFPPPDYTDEMLKGMKYSDLKAEDWDTIPGPKRFELPAKIRGKPLAEQIAYYADRAKKNDDSEDVLFYEHLSTSEWEEAGDIIIEKFGDLLKQLKEKRQTKRRITEQFEAEMEAREKAVRGKSNLLGKKLKEMQASGQDMLKGKMI